MELHWLFDVVLITVWTGFHFGFITFLQSLGIGYRTYAWYFSTYYILISAFLVDYFSLYQMKVLIDPDGIVILFLAVILYSVSTRLIPEVLQIADILCPRQTDEKPYFSALVVKVCEIATQNITVLALVSVLVPVHGLLFSGIILAIASFLFHVTTFLIYDFRIAVMFTGFATVFSLVAPYVIQEVSFSFYAIMSFHLLMYPLMQIMLRYTPKS